MPLFSFGVFKCKIMEINWFAHICTLSHRHCHTVTSATVKKLCALNNLVHVILHLVTKNWLLQSNM